MLETAAVFVSAFLLGVVQCAPSVTTGDAGEFAASAAVLGVPHAPGYPSYILLAKAFGTLMPLGSWAYRTNVLSALCGALAVALLADALRRFGAGRAARLGAAGLLALSPLFREQCAVTEVFALHIAVACGLLWLVAAAGERLLDPGPAAALGLLFGLGLGDHQTLALVLPALLLAGRGRPGSWARALPAAAAGAAAGFLIHAALPLRALKSPPLDWDHAVDARALWRLLARKDYGSLSLTVDGGGASGPDALAAQAWRSLKAVALQLGPLGTAAALLGAAAWRRAGLRLSAASAWAWLLASGPLFLMLGRPGFDAQTSGALERFALLPLVGAVLFAAAGLEALTRVRPAFGAGAALLAAAALAPAAAAQSRRGDFLAQDYGRALLRELPPGSVFVMDGGDDTFYSLAFLKHAQGLRPDVTLQDRGGVVFRGGYGPDFLELPKSMKEDRRRQVEGRWADPGRLVYSTMNPDLLPGRSLLPAGLIRRALKPGERFPESAALDETLNSPRAPTAAARYRDRALLAFDRYSRGASALRRGDGETGVAWLTAAADEGGDALWVTPSVSYALAVEGYGATARRDWTAAERAYRAQSDVDSSRPEPPSDLGVVLGKQGRFPEAEAAMREGLRRDPRSPRPWEALGAFYWERGRFGDSAEAYASAAVLPGAAPGDAAWSARARAKAGR